MNPSYFRIEIPIDQAAKRLRQWWDVPEPDEYIETDSTSAVALACTEDGRWRGGAIFFYENQGWSVFEDLSGGFGFIPAESWLEFAQNDALVVAGYNDSVPYSELIVIEHGAVVRDFVDYPDEPELNRNSGKLPQEDSKPVCDWVEVASFVDDDPLAFSETGWLWVNEPKVVSDQEIAAQKAANLQRWIQNGGPTQWVTARSGKWKDRDLESLLEDLEKTPFWPLDPDHVCNVLEDTTRQWEHGKQ